MAVTHIAGLFVTMCQFLIGDKVAMWPSALMKDADGFLVCDWMSPVMAHDGGSTVVPIEVGTAGVDWRRYITIVSASQVGS